MLKVFDRSPELREIGAGLMIWPNGARSLQALGVEVKGLPIERINFCNWQGRVPIDLPTDAVTQRYHSNSFTALTFKPRWPGPSD